MEHISKVRDVTLPDSQFKILIFKIKKKKGVNFIIWLG